MHAAPLGVLTLDRDPEIPTAVSQPEAIRRYRRDHRPMLEVADDDGRVRPLEMTPETLGNRGGVGILALVEGLTPDEADPLMLPQMLVSPPQQLGQHRGAEGGVEGG